LFPFGKTLNIDISTILSFPTSYQWFQGQKADWFIKFKFHYFVLIVIQMYFIPEFRQLSSTNFFQKHKAFEIYYNKKQNQQI
jgi:hypothetical protein